MPYSGFEPEPTRLRAECHNHNTSGYGRELVANIASVKSNSSWVPFKNEKERIYSRPFGDGPYNFESQSCDEDDTRAGEPPSFLTSSSTSFESRYIYRASAPSARWTSFREIHSSTVIPGCVDSSRGQLRYAPVNEYTSQSTAPFTEVRLGHH
ncbi:hypothetical protein TNCV_127301 [Trichonephila clavipes]|nr:hypothetical protein TNCV_127301 [Trichonephila clavipes]